MKTEQRKSGPENAKNTPCKRTLAGTLTLTATLAALGTSLGVDVNTLFAAEPVSKAGELAPAGWEQFPGLPPVVQRNWNQLPPAVQQKFKGTPLAVQMKWTWDDDDPLP
jgi:hypothetical protein